MLTNVVSLVEHPDALVTVTEYVPLCVTSIDCVVAPLLHEYVVNPVPASSVVVVPQTLMVSCNGLNVLRSSTVTVTLSMQLVMPSDTVT